MPKNKRVKLFKELMNNAFDEEDVEVLEDALSEMGFFTAPASTKFHGAYEGGLFDHSYKVTEALLDLTDKLGLEWQDPRSPYVVGMFHDLCKCDTYVATKYGYEHNKNMALTGHGDKSVILAQLLMSSCVCGDVTTLTDEEVLCIRWHMGAFDYESNWNAYNTSIKRFPNVLYTHTADMIASQIQGI